MLDKISNEILNQLLLQNIEIMNNCKNVIEDAMVVYRETIRRIKDLPRADANELALQYDKELLHMGRVYLSIKDQIKATKKLLQ